MAHKPVVGAVALGVGVYAAMERFKDWEVEQERKKRDRAEQDRREEYLRRLRESQRKRGVDDMSASAAREDAAVNYVINRAFQTGVYSRLEEILYGLAERAGEEGRPVRDGNLQGLNLPLMSNEVSGLDISL